MAHWQMICVSKKNCNRECIATLSCFLLLVLICFVYLFIHSLLSCFTKTRSLSSVVSSFVFDLVWFWFTTQGQVVTMLMFLGTLYGTNVLPKAQRPIWPLKWHGSSLKSKTLHTMLTNFSHHYNSNYTECRSICGH